MADIYTLARWRVKAGKEDAFVEGWKNLGRFFASLPNPPGPGTLVQSVEDPSLFHSFGPWRSLDDVEAMRDHAEFDEALARLRVLCEEATPGAYRVVARVDTGSRPD